MNEVIIKDTNELTIQDREQLLNGFNICFPKHKMLEEELFSKYKKNHFGYSYHAFCEEDGKIIGSLSASPYLYNYNNNNIIIALTCDIFILPDYRNDIRLFSNLYKSLKDYCSNKGIVCFLGVANENAYNYSIRLLRCKELYTLSYWILPVKIGNVVKKNWLKPLNMVSLFYAYLITGINCVISSIFNTTENRFICRIVTDDGFVSSRLPETKYKNLKNDGIFYSYIITNDEDVRCAYIIMIDEKGKRSYKALCKCVLHIIMHEKVDMVMFNGTLGLKQGLLIKTPKKFEPRQLHLTVNYLTKEYEKQYADIMKPNGIDFTLLNLDVR